MHRILWVAADTPTRAQLQIGRRKKPVGQQRISMPPPVPPSRRPASMGSPHIKKVQPDRRHDGAVWALHQASKKLPETKQARSSPKSNIVKQFKVRICNIPSEIHSEMHCKHPDVKFLKNEQIVKKHKILQKKKNVETQCSQVTLARSPPGMTVGGW